MRKDLEGKIRLLPMDSGVYVMLDGSGVVIYVGKAKHLKNRVTQYFQNGYKTEKVAAMVMNIADFYYIITPSEADALTLENTLIKKYKPKYNILLKDDKSYPYIKVDIKSDYPTFTVTRKVKKDGSKYFGPFMLGVSVNDLLEIIKEAFLIRPCQTKINPEKPRKECLNYHIGLCASPCSLKCSKEDYKERVRKAVDFLAGEDGEIESLLKTKMETLAENQEFERALVIRDRLNMVKKLKEKKITAVSKFFTADVIATKSDGIFSSVSVLFIRSGRTTGLKNFASPSLADSDGERIREFITQYYQNDREIPDEIIVSNEFEEKENLENYLSEKNGKKTQIIKSQKGIKKSLLDMAEKNAQEYLEKQISKIKHKNDRTVLALERLKEVLNLKTYPRRMECYDISHISGVDKVGSMVVFIDGEPSKSDYRKFKIKTVEGNNDFASLHEVLLRRMQKLGTNEEEKFPKPDLIIIDGGKGQLSSVKEEVEKYAPDIDLISLAKREEEIYTVYSNEPVVLKKSDFSLQVLQRIRDEAHRFAITFNRNLRGKRALSSILNEIEGVGKQKRNALMDKFGSVYEISVASVEELKTVNGISENLAIKIKEYFENGNF